jgi:hypothetical protein
MPITEGGRFTPDNNIVSPGVFTRENDLSGIAQGVANIGGVVVAPFAKGPGFSPTLVNSVAELESKFGTADGTLYGPYTAKQYLQEKGFVTVTRVGALTGYHQNYPWIVWAENGRWLRNPDAGWLNTTGSSISSAGLTFVTSASNATASNPGVGGYTGSIRFISQPVTVLLSPLAATATGSVPNASGSNLYNGQTVTGTINGFFSFTGSLSVATASATSASILAAIIASGSFTGSITSFAGGALFTSSTAPFDTALILQAGVSQSFGSCAQLVLNFSGFLTGSIGPYNGNFQSGSNLTFDPCTGLWSGSGVGYKVLAVLADTQNATIDSTLHAPGFLGSTQSYNPVVSGSNSVGVEFDLVLSQSNDGGYGTYHYSLDPNSNKYITSVFGKDPRAGNPANFVQGSKIEAAYLYKIFEDDITVVVDNATTWKVHGDALPSGSWTGEPLNFTDQFSLNLLNGDSQFGLTNAYTPWVVSQKISPFNGGSSTRFPLFRLWTLSDGTNTNTSFKIEISNVKLAGTVPGSDWGTFTLTVRDYSDTDKKPKILEQFNNVSLDPTSPNFISRRIGDRFNFIRFDGKIIEFGTYDNLSSFIRVEVSSNPWPTVAVPYGFQAYTTPINGALGHWVDPVAYTKASLYGLFPGKYPSGVDFGGAPSGADNQLAGLYPTASAGEGHFNDNLQYFAPVPSGAGVGTNTTFALDDETTAFGVSTGSFLSGSNAVPSIFDASRETTYVKMRKFVFGFQGGFDGQSPAIPLNTGADITAGNTQGLNCANSTTAGSIAYNQCIGALSNDGEFDINLIVTPGIIYSLHSYVTNLVVEMCEQRGDCFYILDLYQDDGNPTAGQIPQVVDLAGQFDTSYAGSYYPWVKIKDTNINQIVTVPPSVVLPAVYAANDRVAGEWWAAAGLNRGGITQAVQVTDRTTHLERDTLYVGKVNPIAAFPGQGIVVWGQKTLQNADSALNRINVRRLLIEVKKFFASTSRFLVFEQNTAQTRNKFLAIANPYLESVQQRSGLYAFQVVMNDSNNTPDLIDRNILYGQIWLKPTKTAEFIVLDFNILPTGAAFPSA